LEYLGVIAKYVRLYAGGPEAEMAKFLDEYAKRFGQTANWGKTISLQSSN